MNPFITGASGVVGAALTSRLGLRCERLDLTRDDGWGAALAGKEQVVHCAAIASSRGVEESLLRSVNVEGTKRLARIAKESGVKRFVFISSVKVFGEWTEPGECFSDQSEVSPQSEYAVSKLMAEEALWGLHEPGRFEVVVIRPSVVLSPNSKGAIRQLISFAQKGIPFPVVAGGNKRDFVSLSNLVDAVLLALEHPDAGGQAFSVADGAAVSNEALFAGLAENFGRKGRFIRLPRSMSQRLAGSIGVGAVWDRLFGNLEVDSSLIRERLGWVPAQSTLEYVSTAFLDETGK